MRISPVNYTNQKTQNNNSKPAFGIAAEGFIQHIAPSWKSLLEAGAKDSTVLDSLALIRKHPLRVDAHEGVVAILSKKSDAYRPIPQSENIVDTINSIAHDLTAHDRLLEQPKLWEEQLKINEAKAEASQLKAIATELEAQKRFLAWEMPTSEECQKALELIESNKNQARNDENAIIYAKGLIKQSINAIKDFFTEKV